MSEIKTSAKGVDYADPCTLQIKKRVYSQALGCRFGRVQKIMAIMFHRPI